MAYLVESLYRTMREQLSPYKKDALKVRRFGDSVIGQLLAKDQKQWNSLGTIIRQPDYHPTTVSKQMTSLPLEGFVVTWNSDYDQKVSVINHGDRTFGLRWMDSYIKPVFIKLDQVMFFFLQKDIESNPLMYLNQTYNAVRGLSYSPIDQQGAASATQVDDRITRVHFTLPLMVPSGFFSTRIENRRYIFDRIDAFDIMADDKYYQTFVSNGGYYPC